MGYLAPHASQMKKATIIKAPRSNGTRTCAECHAYYSRSEWVGARGFHYRKTDLISTPLHAGHKQDHAANAQEAPNEVDLTNNFPSAEANGVHSRWGEVKEQSHEEANRDPDSAKQSTPPPASVRGNKLSP